MRKSMQGYRKVFEFGGLSVTTVGAVYEEIDKLCDFKNQEPWDNSGFLVGDRERQVKKILVSLDITADTVKEAKKIGADLIVSHHPVIFKGIKELHPSDPAYMLIKYDIAAICAHTCLDAAQGGVNDVLADILELKNVERAESDETSTLLLRVGETKREYTPREFALFVGKKLSAKVLLSDAKRPIKKVMLCTGSGGEFFVDAKANGCDCLVTGESSYHRMLDAKYMGITVIAAGHFETENPVVHVLCEYLKKNINDIEVIESGAKPPIEII